MDKVEALGISYGEISPYFLRTSNAAKGVIRNVFMYQTINEFIEKGIPSELPNDLSNWTGTLNSILEIHTQLLNTSKDALAAKADFSSQTTPDIIWKR